MKAPNQAQLNDPEWWNEHAGTASYYCRGKRQFYDFSLHHSACCVGRPARSEPRPEQNSIADRIMELGNQVHNLGCEVQNDEVLADGCGQIRDQLWYLADQARKEQREKLERKALTDTIKEAVRLGLNEQGISNTVWAAGWRKGEQ